MFDNIFSDLDKLYESYHTTELVTSTGITCEEVDYDIDVQEYATEFVSIYKETIARSITAVCTTSLYPDDYDYTWEPDGAPTYVPYGSTSVLYDDGKGGLESVDVGDLAQDFEIEYFIDDDALGNEEVHLSDDDIKQIFNLDEPGFTELKKTICKVAGSHAKEYIEDTIEGDSDYWPEPEEYEPDYEPDYD